MDPDFNVVIKASIDKIYENPRIVEDAYIKAGQQLDKTKTISEMFKSQEDNWIGSRYDYYPKLSNFYKIVDILKWVIPMFLLLPIFIRKELSNIKLGFKSRETFFSLIAIFTCLIVASFWISKKDYSRFNADNYVTYSYNITINKVFSGEIALEDKKPDLRRAPAYPLFLSLVFVITDQKKKLQDCFENELKPKCDELYFFNASISILFINFVWLFHLSMLLIFK